MKKIITVLMILAAMSMLLSGLTLTAENTADEPEPERKVSVSKEVFDEGEAIIVTASGLSTDYVVFYPVGYVPGKDAGVYYACFDTSVSNRGDWYQVENGVPSDVFDWCCATPQNPQVVPYIDIPEGEYKVVLRDNSGKVIDQVEFTVEYQPPTPTEKPAATPTKEPTAEPVATEAPDPTQAATEIVSAKPVATAPTDNNGNSNKALPWIIAGCAAAVVIIVVVIVVVAAKKNKK